MPKRARHQRHRHAKTKPRTTNCSPTKKIEKKAAGPNDWAARPELWLSPAIRSTGAPKAKSTGRERTQQRSKARLPLPTVVSKLHLSFFGQKNHRGSDSTVGTSNRLWHHLDL